MFCTFWPPKVSMRSYTLFKPHMIYEFKWEIILNLNVNLTYININEVECITNGELDGSHLQWVSKDIGLKSYTGVMLQ